MHRAALGLCLVALAGGCSLVRPSSVPRDSADRFTVHLDTRVSHHMSVYMHCGTITASIDTEDRFPPFRFTGSCPSNRPLSFSVATQEDPRGCRALLTMFSTRYQKLMGQSVAWRKLTRADTSEVARTNPTCVHQAPSPSSSTRTRPMSKVQVIRTDFAWPTPAPLRLKFAPYQR